MQGVKGIYDGLITQTGIVLLGHLFPVGCVGPNTIEKVASVLDTVQTVLSAPRPLI